MCLWYLMGEWWMNWTVVMKDSKDLSILPLFRGRSRDFEKGWCSMPTTIDFRWSKKATITLETISFWHNISISIFKFSPFLYTMEACQWDLINFSKFANTLISKEKKILMQQSMRKEKLRKVGTSFYHRLFYIKSFNMIIIFLFHKLIHSPIFAF